MLKNDTRRSDAVQRNDEITSKSFKAGHRTYFFDVKSTRDGDYYLTISESRKNLDDDGYVRSKIFLYKEDFDRFEEALHDTISFIRAVKNDHTV